MPPQKKQKVEVRFWGVRGSIATHGIQNSRYGGHTPSISIRYGKRWFLCDAGTGIRLAGAELKKSKDPITLLISHLHWDHIFGLPFFLPLFQPGRKILLAGPTHGVLSFKKNFSKLMAPPFFPIRPTIFKADIVWRNLKNGTMKLGPVQMEARQIQHQGKTFAFKFIFPDGKQILYATDHELNKREKSFIRWMSGVDLLIHDSQYDRKQYAKKKGWGHSAFEDVLELAIRQKVKRLILFHHSPESNDRLLEKRLQFCRERIRRFKSPLKCFLAQEGKPLLF